MNYILGSASVTVYMDGKPYTINKQAQTYEMVMRGIKENSADLVRQAVNIRGHIVNSLNKVSSLVRIENGSIFCGDREITGLVNTRIFEMMKAGLNVDPMIRFIEKLMQNPSKRAVDELFGFMEACNLPVTPDGDFLAYKRVRDNYKDVHSNTMDNSVGQVLEMPRNAVDDDKNNTCSYGLHFCSYDYLRHFSGERIVVVKINPADVVAIPADYNNSKGRTCRYEVVDEIAVNEYNMPTQEIEKFTTENNYEVENPSAKLSANDVIEIRQELDEGMSLSEIARLHNVSPRQIARIRDGKAWKNV